MARLVITHSTYIEGLIPKLKQLALKETIKTITPGQITRTKANCSNFRMRISVKTDKGFKIIARKGNSCQEIFVVTNLNTLAMNELLNGIK